MHGVDYGAGSADAEAVAGNERTLVGMTRAHADIAHVAGLHHVVKGLHGLLNRSRVVETVAWRKFRSDSLVYSSDKESHIAERRCTYTK